MASFNANPLKAGDINGGQQFVNGNAFTPQNVNAIVEGILHLNQNGGSGGGSGGGSTIYKHSFYAYNGNAEYNGWFYALTNDKIVESSIEHNQLLISQTNFTFVIGNVVMEHSGEVSIVELNTLGQFVFGEDYFTQGQITENVEGV